MANVSAAYHALISTCRAHGIVAQAYLKKLFREVVKAHRDYENLLPMTIGISANKLLKSSPAFENFKRKNFPKRLSLWGTSKLDACHYNVSIKLQSCPTKELHHK